MRAYAQLRTGRAVALGIRVWMTRLLQIHAVAAVSLAPLLIVPELLATEPVLRLDITKGGPPLSFFGTFVTGWAVAWNFLHPAEGALRNLMIVYLAQFAVSVLLVRDAWRHMTGRAPRCGPLAFLSLGLFALGGLAVFSLLNSVAVAAFDGSGPISLVLLIATVIGELYIAGACWLAVPAIAADGRGLFAAMGRSFLLSQGSRFQVSALIAMLTVAQGVILIPIGILIAAFDSWRLEWALLVPVCLVQTLKACVLAACYQEACYRKEGEVVEDVSKVFA